MELTTFKLGDDWYGVDVLSVQEIMDPLPISSLPLAPDYVKGLLNVRGIIVTVISLKKRLNIASEYSEEYQNVIIDGDDKKETVCLMVDEIGDVIRCEDDMLIERPAMVDKIAAPFITGICKVSDRLITILNPQAIAGV
jgi:purine-binding chemotaxis protein CheW